MAEYEWVPWLTLALAGGAFFNTLGLRSSVEEDIRRARRELLADTREALAKLSGLESETLETRNLARDLTSRLADVERVLEGIRGVRDYGPD